VNWVATTVAGCPEFAQFCYEALLTKLRFHRDKTSGFDEGD
jgi:hypothetical protein